jgi:hypothetical protein
MGIKPQSKTSSTRLQLTGVLDVSGEMMLFVCKKKPRRNGGRSHTKMEKQHLSQPNYTRKMQPSQKNIAQSSLKRAEAGRGYR